VSPLAFVILYVALSAAAFLAGWSFTRTAEPRGAVSVAQARRFGRLLMMAATALIFFLVALWLHGDLKPLRS
jgi:hypothetical protein